MTTPAKKSELRDKGPYRVLDTRDAILYPSDDAQLERMLKGDRIPLAERKMKEAKPGDLVTDLPAASVANMLAKGWIVKANGPDDPYRKPDAKAKDEGGEA